MEKNQSSDETSKGDFGITTIRKLHEKWMKDPEYRDEYDSLEGEFAIARALIKARSDAGLTQEELARRMNTKHLEDNYAGHTKPHHI